MTTRRARLARAALAAGFATLVAAVSHSAADASAPGTLALVLSVTFSLLVCIGLTGKQLSRWRLSAAVAVSQFGYHGLFSLFVGHSGHGAQVAAGLGAAPGSVAIRGLAGFFGGHDHEAMLAQLTAFGSSGMSSSSAAAELNLAASDFWRTRLSALCAALARPLPIRKEKPVMTTCSNAAGQPTGSAAARVGRRGLRVAAALAGAALLAVSAPLAAAAHVNVVPGQADAGSYATLTFKVPNESQTEGTVKLEVDLPTETPFTSVSYQPIAGWSAEIVTAPLATPVEVHGSTITEAPSKVIWTADKGVSVTAGQFQQFVISAGPVPDTGSVALPAHQTYSDGTVVSWDEDAEDGAEPAHPSPVLYINDAPPADGHGDAGDAEASVTPDENPAGDGAQEGNANEASVSGDATLWVAFGGLALGAVALVVAVFAAVNRKRVDQ